MRALIVLMVAVAVVTLALVISPSLRAKAEAILFGRESVAPAPAAESEEPAPLAETAEKAGEAVKKAWDTAARKVAEAGGQNEPQAPVRAPAETAEPESAAPPAPAHPPQPAAAAQTQPAAGVTRPFAMPPALNRVNFGMSSSQVAAAYAPKWQRQQSGELMLAYYPLQDDSQIYRFHLSGDSLYLIEVHLKPPEGRTLEELYDYYQQGLAQRYQDLAEAGKTRWSDGTVTVRIKRDTLKDLVVITYSCPKAKG